VTPLAGAPRTRRRTRSRCHRDAPFTSGRVGLWTKGDAVTAFDDLTIRGVSGS